MLRKVLIFILSVILTAVIFSMSEAWKVDLSDKVFGGVIYAVVDGQSMFFIADLNGKLYAVDQYGQKQWSENLGLSGNVYTTPVHIYGQGNNYLVVVDDAGNMKVVRLLGTNGDVFDLAFTKPGNEVSGSPSGGTIYSNGGTAYSFVVVPYSNAKKLGGYLIAMDSSSATVLDSTSVTLDSAVNSTAAIKFESRTAQGSATVYIASDGAIYKFLFDWDIDTSGATLTTSEEASYAIENNYHIQSAIALDEENGKVYAIGYNLFNSQVFAFSMSELEKTWSYVVNGFPYSNISPVIDDEGYVYVAIGNSVYKFSSTGSKVWKTSLDEEVLTSPMISGEETDGEKYLYVLSKYGAIYKINIATGEITDTYAVYNPYKDQFYSPPLSVLSKLVFAGYNEKLYAVNISDTKGGSGRWPTFKYLGSRSGSADYNGPLPTAVSVRAYDVTKESFITVDASYSLNGGSMHSAETTFAVGVNVDDKLGISIQDSSSDVYDFDNIEELTSKIATEDLKENDTFVKFKEWEIEPDDGATDDHFATFTINVDGPEEIVADVETYYKVVVDYDLSDETGEYNEVDAFTVMNGATTEITPPSSRDYEFESWTIYTPTATYTNNDYANVEEFNEQTGEMVVKITEPIVVIGELTKVSGEATLYVQNTAYQDEQFYAQLVINEIYSKSQSLAVELHIPNDIPLYIKSVDVDRADLGDNNVASPTTSWVLVTDSSTGGELLTPKDYILLLSWDDPATLDTAATITFELYAGEKVKGIRTKLSDNFEVNAGSKYGGIGKVKVVGAEPLIQPVVGDFNGDRVVDQADFFLFLKAYGSKEGDSNYNVIYDIAPRENFSPPSEGYKAGDPDPDGEINAEDFAVFAVMYGYDDRF